MMKYRKENNNKYIENHIEKDRLNQFVNDIKLEFLNEIENNLTMITYREGDKYGTPCIEGDADALSAFRIWLSEKKVELNTETN